MNISKLLLIISRKRKERRLQDFSDDEKVLIKHVDSYGVSRRKQAKIHSTTLIVINLICTKGEWS